MHYSKCFISLKLFVSQKNPLRLLPLLFLFDRCGTWGTEKVRNLQKFTVFKCGGQAVQLCSSRICGLNHSIARPLSITSAQIRTLDSTRHAHFLLTLTKELVTEVERYCQFFPLPPTPCSHSFSRECDGDNNVVVNNNYKVEFLRQWNKLLVSKLYFRIPIVVRISVAVLGNQLPS